MPEELPDFLEMRVHQLAASIECQLKDHVTVLPRLAGLLACPGSCRTHRRRRGGAAGLTLGLRSTSAMHSASMAIEKSPMGLQPLAANPA